MPGMNKPAAESQAPPSDASPNATKPETTLPETKAPVVSAPVTTPPAANMNDSDMRDMVGMNGDGTAHAMHSMEDRQMNMSPHMKMTTLRETQPGDQEKADAVVAAARDAANKYTDYKIALAEGYKIFLPNLPQKQ